MEPIKGFEGALYTLCLKKNVPLYFYDNFVKYRLILIILSLTHSWMNASSLAWISFTAELLPLSVKFVFA